MKKYLILFAVGLLACAGQRGIKYDTTGNYLVLGEDVEVTLQPSLLESEVSQQFDVKATITFPKMTLQQAAELEARVRKLFPEAQEIDFGLEKKIEAPAESFYYEIPDGMEFRILPGTLPRVYNTLPFNPGQDLRIEIDSTENVIYFSAPSAPREGLKPGSILQADSTGMPAWREF